MVFRPSINQQAQPPACSIFDAATLSGQEVDHAENARMTTVPGANVGETNGPRAHMDDEIWPSAIRLLTIIAPYAPTCYERGNQLY
ncbi:unnamed protein product [Schistocephalus solidus]|uniref:Uncharacterized protein n=1 Tax=Schistocephalus solidus TaxID=70667 RepID=A0A183TEM4_SCHSO|nr:unnamed protein product [Schistocephalus solidus]